LDPSSPISPDEFILRRVPQDKMNLDGRSVSPDAFAPSERDQDGLSLHRAAFHTPEEVGQTLRSKGTAPAWVVRFLAKDLLALQLLLKPDPKQPSAHPKGIAQPGHILIPDINFNNRKSDRVIQLKRDLAEIANRSAVLGPFEPPSIITP